MTEFVMKLSILTSCVLFSLCQLNWMYYFRPIVVHLASMNNLYTSKDFGLEIRSTISDNVSHQHFSYFFWPFSPCACKNSHEGSTAYDWCAHEWRPPSKSIQSHLAMIGLAERLFTLKGARNQPKKKTAKNWHVNHDLQAFVRPFFPPLTCSI